MKKGFILAQKGVAHSSIDGMDQAKVTAPTNLDRNWQRPQIGGHSHGKGHTDQMCSVIARNLAECKVLQTPGDFVNDIRQIAKDSGKEIEPDDANSGKDIEPGDPTHGKEIELRDNTAREGNNTGHTRETLDQRAAGASEVEEVD